MFLTVLVPMVMDEAWINRVRSTLPELPAERRSRYEAQGLDFHLAGVMSAAPETLRSVHDAAVEAGASSKVSANWLTGEVTAFLRRSDRSPDELTLSGEDLAELGSILEEGVVSSSAAKEVLEGVLSGEGSPRMVAEARDLVQISDTSAIDEIVIEVLDQNAEAVENYRAGEQKVVGFLVGQVMRASQGKADPKIVNQLLRAKLDG